VVLYRILNIIPYLLPLRTATRVAGFECLLPTAVASDLGRVVRDGRRNVTISAKIDEDDRALIESGVVGGRNGFELLI
jgi:hypothetical protein